MLYDSTSSRPVREIQGPPGKMITTTFRPVSRMLAVGRSVGRWLDPSVAAVDAVWR